MNLAGLLFMLVSVVGVWALTGWCFFKVLTLEAGDRRNRKKG